VNKEQRKEARLNLIKLISENPELDVVPLVHNDAVHGDDYGYWIAQFGKAEIVNISFDDERAWILEDDKEELLDSIADELFDVWPEDESMAEQAVTDVFNRRKWERVIAVRINEF